MLKGEHWYCPESSGDTLGRVSVSASESFPVRSSTADRPVLSELAATTQLLSSPFPKHEANMSTYARHHQNVSQHRAKNLHPVALDKCIHNVAWAGGREKRDLQKQREKKIKRLLLYN